MILRNKRSNDDIKANRPTIDEVKFIPKSPIYFFLENIRSAHNVGSIFRTADQAKLQVDGYSSTNSPKRISLGGISNPFRDEKVRQCQKNIREGKLTENIQTERAVLRGNTELQKWNRKRHK